MRVGLLLAAIAVLTFLGGYELGHSQGGMVAPPVATTADPTTAWQPFVAATTTAGQKLGYEVRVAPAEFGMLEATFVKEGKSETGHGILGKKWDERETIQVRYLPTENGLQPTSVKRLVEQKPPIGGWKTITESNDAPSALLAVKPAE